MAGRTVRRVLVAGLGLALVALTPLTAQASGTTEAAGEPVAATGAAAGPAGVIGASSEPVRVAGAAAAPVAVTRTTLAEDTVIPRGVTVDLVRRTMTLTAGRSGICGGGWRRPVRRPASSA
ncbi:hypothetical protein ABMX48_02080 [Streptomyces cavourensis]